MNNTYNECINDVRDMLGNFYEPEHLYKFPYSMNFLNDLGAMPQCEDQSALNASYVQFNIRVTNLPLVIPMSACLPKSCGDKEIYKRLMAELQLKGNNLVELVKKLVNFDTLHGRIPLELDQDLFR